MKPSKFLFVSVVSVLIVIIGYSGYRVWSINNIYAQEAQMHERLIQYRPIPQSGYDRSVPDGGVINQGILELQAKYPDVVGWLTIPNTSIDYPFAQSHDNEYYLHLDLDKNNSSAGTLFIDFRNNSDFNDFNTLIFGHSMRNGSMFGTLENFSNGDFFNFNASGTVLTANEVYEIEFMAFAVINPDDATIYNPIFMTDADKLEFLSYIRDAARHYRDIDATINDNFVTLSTCNYEFNNARMVLVGRIASTTKAHG